MAGLACGDPSPIAFNVLSHSADFFLSVPDSLDDNGVRQALSQADMPLVMADLSSKSDTLTFAFTTPRYMDKEANEVLKPFIRPLLKYVWREGRFVPVTSL